jgi:septum formation protein
VVRPANIDEIPLLGEKPLAFAERMALEKARAAREKTDEIILAADTVVALEDQILGKPQDANDAVRMLRLLSGKTHSVITGVCVAGKNFEDVRSETTSVEFLRISDGEIREYVKSGEPMDKAGAYAIQGGASEWISKVAGDYDNVVGLPVDRVMRMFQEREVL